MAVCCFQRLDRLSDEDQLVVYERVPDQFRCRLLIRSCDSEFAADEVSFELDQKKVSFF